MFESTTKLKFAFACLLVLVSNPLIALAKPTIGVAPLTFKIPSVGQGLSQIIALELAAGGRFEVLGGTRLETLLGKWKVDPQAWYQANSGRVGKVSGTLDYLLTGEIVVFDVVDKDTIPDWGSNLRDLGALFGGNSEVAHVAFELTLVDTRNGEAAFSQYFEGFESKKGVRTGPVTYGWAAKTNFQSDGFRETQLGRAAYKALGDFLSEIYSAFPLEGAVVGVIEDAIVVDLAEQSGLAIGDELILLRRREITNSQGIVVWVSEERVGSASIIEFQGGRCLCLLLDGVGKVSEGDVATPLVETYLLPIEADQVKN